MDAAEVHREIVDRYLAGRHDEALELLDPDVVDHRGGADGDHHGVGAWREKWERTASGPFQDMTVTVEQNVATDDISVNRYTFTGPGFQVTGLDMVRVRDGRVVEHWALLDTEAIRHQTGR